jgi:hypothetical protein
MSIVLNKKSRSGDTVKLADLLDEGRDRTLA